MAFEKISTISLTDLFVEQIEGKILSGELSVGDKLPSARELTTLIGVSRPVISAGLIELEKLGFIEIIPRILLLFIIGNVVTLRRVFVSVLIT